MKVQEEGGFGKGGLRRQAQPKAGRNRTARRAPCRPGNRPPRQHPGDTGHSLPGTAQQRPRGAGQGAARFPLLSLQEPRGLREAGPLGCGLTEQLSLACMHRCSSHNGARSPPSRLLAEKPPGSCQAVLHTPAPSARPQRAQCPRGSGCVGTGGWRGATPHSRPGGAAVRGYPSSKVRSSGCTLLEQL